VLCGGITTANATLYLIDTVLTPPLYWLFVMKRGSGRVTRLVA